MGAVDVPLVWQAIGSIAGAGAVAGWLAWKEGRKVKKSAVEEDPTDGASRLVAASIMGTRELADLTASIRSLDGSVRGLDETIGRVEPVMLRMVQQMHDDFIMRATSRRSDT